MFYAVTALLEYINLAIDVTCYDTVCSYPGIQGPHFLLYVHEKFRVQTHINFQYFFPQTF